MMRIFFANNCSPSGPSENWSCVRSKPRSPRRRDGRQSTRQRGDRTAPAPCRSRPCAGLARATVRSTGLAADGLRRFQNGTMWRSGVVIVALHAGCRRPRSRSSRCSGSSADRSHGSRCWSPIPCRRYPVEADAPPDLLTPLTASARRLSLTGAAVRVLRLTAPLDRADRDRETPALAAPGRQGRHICPRAQHAPSQPRARPIAHTITADVIG